MAVRSGRSVFTILLIDRPVRAWASQETASAANTIVRWASMLSRSRWKSAGGQIGLGHPEGAFDLVEVVVGGHDPFAVEHLGADVGDVALPIPLSG